MMALLPLAGRAEAPLRAQHRQLLRRVAAVRDVVHRDDELPEQVLADQPGGQIGVREQRVHEFAHERVAVTERRQLDRLGNHFRLRQLDRRGRGRRLGSVRSIGHYLRNRWVSAAAQQPPEAGAQHDNRDGRRGDQLHRPLPVFLRRIRRIRRLWLRRRRLELEFTRVHGCHRSLNLNTYRALPVPGYQISGVSRSETVRGLPPPRPVLTATYCTPPAV